MCGLAVAAFLLPLMPAGIILKALSLFVGLEFFCLVSLRHHLPHYRQFFSVLHLVLWDLPTDAEYRLEVYRAIEARRREVSDKKDAATQGEVDASDLRRLHVTMAAKGELAFTNPLITEIDCSRSFKSGAADVAIPGFLGYCSTDSQSPSKLSPSAFISSHGNDDRSTLSGVSVSEELGALGTCRHGLCKWPLKLYAPFDLLISVFQRILVHLFGHCGVVEAYDHPPSILTV
jgi:hypothetical protein